jgi:GNAT superfamily N-acetyltransferase
MMADLGAVPSGRYATFMAEAEQSDMRRFQPSDLGRLQQLILQTIDVSYSSVYPPRALGFFKAFHAERKILERCAVGTVLVTEHSGVLVATGSLVKAEILAVFVHPQTQRRGYGKALMSVLEDEARRSGETEVSISVSLPSRRFYEGLGYEILQPCSRCVGDGQRLNFWKARKKLIPIAS